MMLKQFLILLIIAGTSLLASAFVNLIWPLLML
jgi:hypothetical protein